MPDQQAADQRRLLDDAVAKARAASERWRAEEGPPRPEPVERWYIEVTATRTTAESIVKFAKLSGAKEGICRRIRR